MNHPDNKDWALYWTNFSLIENCGQGFLWRKGWGRIDVGGGMGKPKPPPIRDSVHNAIPGRVLSRMMEEFYNEQLYKDPSTVREKLQSLIHREFSYQLTAPRNYIDWSRSPTRMQMRMDLYATIPGFLRTVVKQKLFGKFAKAEMDLKVFIAKDKYPVGGKMDLVFTRETENGDEITILDGKNSKHKDKYSDPDQLVYYALIFYLVYGRMPDRLGWLWYKYPYGTVAPDGSIEEGVKFIDFTLADLKEMATRAVTVHKLLEKEEFDANPTPKGCRFCPYETVCPERVTQRKANAAKRAGEAAEEHEDLEGFESFSM